jgi:putative heme-binding domain-containing protein
VVLIAMSHSSELATQGKKIINPFAGDPEAVQQGKSIFRMSCAPCHGIDARGVRGPDLTSGRWVHGDSDEEIFRIITRGIPATEMPPGELNDEEVWMIIAFLRGLGSGTGERVKGNPEAGKQIFTGTAKCSHCHMVKGKGGRLGPDLSRIGASRSTRYIIDSIRDPSKEIAIGYETVVAVTNEGQRICAVRKNEDTFLIQVMDPEEQLHFFSKKDLKEITYERKSLMPEYNEQILKDDQLQDVAAYLDTLRGE